MSETRQWPDEAAYDEWLNEMLAHTPDSWDDDASAEGILTDFVGHAVEQVKKNGGCLNKWCRWDDDEACDHGYLAADDAIKAYEEVLDENGYVNAPSRERLRRQLDFLTALADGGEIKVNGIPWREAFEGLNALVSDPV